MNWQALWEGAKEPLRLLVMALVSWGITELTKLDVQWAVLLTFILRFVDSWLHEIALAEPKKDRNEGLLGVKGLTGF